MALGQRLLSGRCTAVGVGSRMADWIRCLYRVIDGDSAISTMNVTYNHLRIPPLIHPSHLPFGLRSATRATTVLLYCDAEICPEATNITHEGATIGNMLLLMALQFFGLLRHYHPPSS